MCDVRGWKPNARRRVKNLCSLENRHDPDALILGETRKIKCKHRRASLMYLLRAQFVFSLGCWAFGLLACQKNISCWRAKGEMRRVCLRTHSHDVCFSNLSKYVRAPIHYDAEHQTHTTLQHLSASGPASQIKTSMEPTPEYPLWCLLYAGNRV